MMGMGHRRGWGYYGGFAPSEEQMFEHYTEGDDGFVATYLEGDNSHVIAQILTPSASHVVKFVRLKLYKSGEVADNQTVIISPLVGGYPDLETILAEGTFDAGALTTDTDGKWVAVYMQEGYALEAGTPYGIWIASDRPSPDLICWRADQSSPGYSGGKAVTWWGSWSDVSPDSDFIFEEWGT